MLELLRLWISIQTDSSMIFCVYVSATKMSTNDLSLVSFLRVLLLAFLLFTFTHRLSKRAQHDAALRPTFPLSHSFIHSFVRWFSLAFSIFIPLWHTNTHTASIRRNRLFFVALPPPSRLSLLLLCHYSLFLLRSPQKRHYVKKKVQNTVRESLSHTQTHINTRER